jgi:hypothetical protein
MGRWGVSASIRLRLVVGTGPLNPEHSFKDIRPGLGLS